jgi:hypothetical protein
MSIDLEETETPNGVLADVLGRVAEKMTEIAAAEQVVKRLEKELAELEGQATEQLGMSGLERCTVAGKTWWRDEALLVSSLKDYREEMLEAAKAEKLDDAIAVNTATLKAWLTERAKARNIPLEDAVKGTRFDGLVSQFVKIRLRSRTTG